MPTQQPTILGRISIVLLIIIVGIPAGYLLIVGTWGTILIPFIIAFYATPLFLFHYVVWGRALSRKLRVEAEDRDVTRPFPFRQHEPRPQAPAGLLGWNSHELAACRDINIILCYQVIASRHWNLLPAGGILDLRIRRSGTLSFSILSGNRDSGEDNDVFIAKPRFHQLQP